MTKPNPSADVLFYVLNSSDLPTREAFTSKLLRKIFKEARQADVLFPSLADAQRFDLFLWSEKPEVFLPHAVAHEFKAPIQLFGEQVIKPQQDVLLNLHTEFQKNFLQYQRTIEILDQTQTLYRTLGIEPIVHKIGY